MKIAVLLAAPWIPGSVDMTEYLRVLRDLGHEPVMICLDHSKGSTDFPVYPADLARLQTPGFYEALKLDAAIAFTWFNYPGIIAAMKKAGVRTLIRGDSDGLLSIRQFPGHHYRVRMSAALGPLQSAIAMKHLAQRYLFDYRGEDRDRLASIGEADISVLETAEAMKHVSRFLEWQNRPDLIGRLRVVPHLVGDAFLNGEVNTARSKSVVSIGRWDDPQKNAPLLAATIRLHLLKKPETKFFIIGGEAGRSAFAQLTAAHPQVTYTGPQIADGVRRHLADARVLLSASRWEGSPVVGNEALSLGTTVVGTPIPAFCDIVNRGGFGTISKFHTPDSLATALDAELGCWEKDGRNPVSIAEYWRPKLSAETVVSTLVRLLMGHTAAAAVQSRVAEAVLS